MFQLYYETMSSLKQKKKKNLYFIYFCILVHVFMHQVYNEYLKISGRVKLKLIFCGFLEMRHGYFRSLVWRNNSKGYLLGK